MFGFFKKKEPKADELTQLLSFWKEQVVKGKKEAKKSRGPGKKKSKSTESLHLYVTPQEKEAIQRVADESNRTTSNLLRDWTIQRLDDERFRAMSTPRKEADNSLAILLESPDNQHRYEDGFYDHWVRDRIRRNLAAHKKRYNSFIFESEIYDWVRSIPCQKTQRQMAYWKVGHLNKKFKQSDSYRKYLDSKGV